MHLCEQTKVGQLTLIRYGVHEAIKEMGGGRYFGH